MCWHDINISLDSSALQKGYLTIDRKWKKGDKVEVHFDMNVRTVRANGFGGALTVLVGFDNEGKIIDYSLLSHAETPGLGSESTVSRA